MTAAPPGPNLFSILKIEKQFRSHISKSFAASLFFQAAILALIIYFTTHGVINGPTPVPPIPGSSPNRIFYGQNGGGGGNHETLPASVGTPPRASIEAPIIPATVIVVRETNRLMVEPTIELAPEVKYTVGGQIGDPNSPFSQWLSNGPGRDGIGKGCCGGDGDSTGPYVGNGPSGPVPAGRGGVSMPEAIYSPEPTFSDEARKQKVQGIVLLMLVVGKDGHTYDIHVRQSLGMGLDEQAIEAVKTWRFRPATLEGKPVDTQIAVEVNFRLY